MYTTIISTIRQCKNQQFVRWNINIIRIVIIVDLRNQCNRCFIHSGNQRLKERFNKIEIEIDSEYKSQLKRFRKPPLLLSQEESLAKEVKKYPCLFDKSQKMYKERDIYQTFSISKTFLLLLHVFNTFFFEVVKTKITSYQTLWYPFCFQLSNFCVTIIATITFVIISRFLDEI